MVLLRSDETNTTSQRDVLDAGAAGLVTWARWEI